METHTIRLVQLRYSALRHVALVMEPNLVIVNNFGSVYELAWHVMNSGLSFQEILETNLSETKLDYDAVYGGQTKWKLLPSFDDPENPLHCMVSGTGLTHRNSALNRQMMHQSDDAPTDSMRMYQWGLEGGSPPPGKIGVQPEWFYKGNGTILQGHGDALTVPAYANDGGEEPEVAGVYMISKNGTPCRIGFTTGNEFSDHVMEKKNYLYLAPSKLRMCSIGPELVIDGVFGKLTGEVSISRNGSEVWKSAINTGEENMAHHLANLEHHHFKYESHCIPGQSHVHFFGADAFSFGNKITLKDGDVMHVRWDKMGRALANTIKISNEKERLTSITSLH
jgi:hypothetical protein